MGNRLDTEFLSPELGSMGDLDIERAVARMDRYSICMYNSALRPTAGRVLRLALACLAGLIAAGPVLGQTSSTGALTITVKDASGAVVPGAMVTIINTTGLTRSQESNSDGVCSFGLLQPETYKVTISAPGFKTAEIPAVTVHVTETQGLQQALQVGEQQQEVQVVSTAETIQTETSTLGGVVGTRSIDGLPLVTRNFTQILSLSTGVVTDVTNASAAGRGALQNIYVNGQDNISNNYQMDGVSINNYAIGAPADAIGYYGNIPIPSPDALQEFKVQTSLYDASYGRNSGANVDIITKSGSNDWHGSLFEFFRNNDLNANTFFQNSTGQPRGVLKQNQFGGVLGGPIKKDKLFFFLTYQGTRQINGVASSATSSVTLPATLTNDRSRAGLGAAFCPNNNPAGTPGYSYSRTFEGGAPTFPNNQVACDGSNISSVALALLNAKLPNGSFVIPTPQIIRNPGTQQAVGFSAFSVPATFKEEQALGDLDYRLSAKNTFALKYYYSIGTLISPFTAAGQPPNGGNTGLSGNSLYSAKWTSLQTSNLVNEARFSVYYIRASLQSLVPVNVNQIGLTPSNPSSTLAPVMTINGLFSNFGSATDGTKTPQITYEWADQLSWTHGRHTIRAGYDQQHVFWNICSCGKIRGSLTFQTWADFLLGESAAQNGTPLSNIFASSAAEQLWSTPNFLRENQGSLFVLDDIKVNQRLTLNLGLRWEYDGTAYDTLPIGGTNYVWSMAETVPIPPTSGTYVGFTVAKNYKGPLPDGIVRRNTEVLTNDGAPLHDFAPRFGFAWQPFSTHSVVVRGGSGFFYDVVFGNAWLQTLNTTPPNAALLSYSSTQNALATFAVPFNPPVAPGSFAGFARTPTSAISQHGVDPGLVTPLTINWNFNLQYEFKPTWVLEVGYVGNRGMRIVAPEFYNIPSLASAGNPINCGAPFGCISTNTAANAAQRLPVLGMSVDGAQMAANIGDSNYHSLQAALRKTFSHGLQFQASYTYGRCFSDLAGTSIGGGVGLATNSNDPNSRAQQYGPCDFNRPQRLVFNYTYELPSFHNNQGLLGRGLSGWGLSGVTTIQSGLPITFTDTRGGAVYDFAGASRAEICPGETYSNIATSGSVESRLTDFFNTSAFCAVPAIGQINGVGGATGYGNTGRGILLGPPQKNWDIALTKKTQVGGIHEGAYLEFRSEFFNTFNHPQFSNPPSNVAVPSTFGVITTTSVGPRILQFALRYAF